MALPLSCACGARFEVEDTFANQMVSCPECHEALKAPGAHRLPLRTSGYALASVIVALVFGFVPLFGPVLAVVLGLAGLVSISRHPDRVTGVGYAAAGIVIGLIFAGLSALAFTKVELFDQVRGHILGSQVDRAGPMEIVRDTDGFAITRPSPSWGVARPDMLKELNTGSVLTLVEPGKDAYMDVSIDWVGGRSIDQCRDDVVAGYREPGNDFFGNRRGKFAKGEFKLRESHHLPALNGAQVEEVILDGRVYGQAFTFLIRLVKDEGSGRLYVLRGWVHQRKFDTVKPDMVKAMDSFRLLAQAPGF